MTYDALAPFYDQIHADLTQDAPFILALATGGGGSILELGCGSGRLMEPLARAGFQLFGVDNSPAMLAQARRKLAGLDAVTLLQSDMATFTLPTENIALAVLGYNTFMHIHPQAAPGVLRRVARHLTADGRLFIDLANPFHIARLPEDSAVTFERSFTHSVTGERVVQTSSSSVAASEQLFNVIWFFDVLPHDGGAARRHIVFVTYHYYYPHQLELLLNRAGLQLQEQYGDYHRSDFGEHSDRLLIIAGK